MPQLDRTGPFGLGRRTGRRRGFCFPLAFSDCPYVRKPSAIGLSSDKTDLTNYKNQLEEELKAVEKALSEE